MQQIVNLVGPNIVKFRWERDWTQEELASRLQVNGCYMTRDMIANIESQRRCVFDYQLDAFAEVFGVTRDELFPPRQRRRKHRGAFLPE
jgi:transcriptional regulator with XRE-family HTH domain